MGQRMYSSVKETVGIYFLVKIKYRNRNNQVTHQSNKLTSWVNEEN